ncbi:MAG: class A beta-lactamase-related serine hydrolase [Defluviitaleaceae bacterium]|nr:class A beta-lactamase-related serine hydrolase [Defluviitaleaceae bacterium]
MRLGKTAYAVLVPLLCAVIAGSIFVVVRNVLSFRPTAAAVLAEAPVAPTEYATAQTAPEEETPQRHHIPWLFTAYAEPDFRADQVAAFNPQYVTILYEGGDGWALADTSEGEVWVYLRDNLLYLTRVVGMFEDAPQDGFATGHHIDILRPQLVRVLDQDGYWLRIETWAGPMWVNRHFTPSAAALDEVIGRFGNRVSVFYENFETGFVYTHNADRVFFGASAIKGPYALWVHLLAEAGYTDLGTIHTFTSADMWGGSGVIQRMPVGSTFTEAELIGLALSVSDNIAFRMLVRRIHGVPGFRDWVEEVGAEPGRVHTVTYSRLTAGDAGIFAREKHRYIESGGRYSEDFREHLLANRYAFVVSDHPVGSKSGWAQEAFHDIAIVYAPSPYSLSILSAGTGGGDDRRMFREISMAIQYFNDRYFPGNPAN